MEEDMLRAVMVKPGKIEYRQVEKLKPEATIMNTDVLILD
ncbi:unnamed protein product [marine sediment metagenome]|uniref:Uncharacterized protein n=1 Tax=marine sediment metagenome TaxID=412755 RepID=X1VWS8_9ZZZZ